MSYVAPSAPLSIGGVLDNWLRLFRESFGRCWPLAAIASVAVGILIFLFKPPQSTQAMTLWEQRLQSWATINGPQGPLAAVLMIMIALVVTGALLAAQAGVVRARPLTFAEALTAGLRRLPRMLWGFVLVALAAMGVGLAVGIPLAIVTVVAGITAGLTHHSGTGLAGHLLAFGLTVIFAIGALIAVSYVTVRLQLWQPAIFTEDDTALASLSRSWRLVGGHWWRTTAILFVGGIVIGVLGYAVPWLIGLAFGVFGTGTGGLLPGALFALQLTQLFAQATRVITLPLTTSLSLAIYHDLKLRREGADLAARTEALSGA